MISQHTECLRQLARYVQITVKIYRPVIAMAYLQVCVHYAMRERRFLCL